MSWQLELFKELTEAPGAPGFEDEVRKIMRKHLASYADEVVQDNLGSIFGKKTGNENSPTIMVAGHMDEVGFLVTQITEKGFIQFQNLGGWWSQVMLAQRVHIITPNGPVEGVIGSIPPHVLTDEVRKKPMDMKKMFIDIGADSKEDAEKIGVRPGQPIIPVCPFKVMANPKKIMAKAWDNRYGCALSIELLKELKEEKLSCTVYSGATVQEEVGLRGAATAADMIKPDIFFALDAGPANDIPGSGEGFGKLGEGPLMRIYDRSMISHPGLRDFLIDTAEEEGIPYQFFVSQGGTDAGRVHMSGKGVPSAVIGIPARYIHSHASIIHYDDYENAKKLLIAAVKRLDKDTVKRIRSR
ncbi:M42 family metallopeptidase [Microaerobacter geothermalis]|nr:M42 family metallopeptidase [Microaerobacter geothermalis]MCF6094160.1 M42 family metallopeptidase [Microaerobacter geothermalis]